MLELNSHLEDLKSETQLLKEYQSDIVDRLNQSKNKLDYVEGYLEKHLATDYEKIKETVEDFKNGLIDAKELLKRGIKGIGKKFLLVAKHAVALK